MQSPTSGDRDSTRRPLNTHNLQRKSGKRRILPSDQSLPLTSDSHQCVALETSAFGSTCVYTRSLMATVRTPSVISSPKRCRLVS
ncbi:hypothetical protein F8388_012796 [Cannabis sativa]|uniref:Uncharacterized protein n=1 Tax=Cannabis sativa TaxID=3483 RepID=A0A7J6F410_CANSA|nr:hypothetical protein F8388_012796 [Cannabis sativa]